MATQAGHGSRSPRVMPPSGLRAALLPQRMSERLPDRVRRAIADQQAESEVLIGWIQLLIVLTFASLYTISPKTAPMEAFNPVPWAFAGYFVFTCVRLVLAYRRRLSRFFVGLSVIVDMTMLMLVIWSFHLQYMQPPAFYLKVPTILYVFIFIALRALRFEPFLVLLSGVAAALGWAVLVAYAVLADADAVITRDFIVYTTTPSILFGAAFDKLLTILMVTLIMALALSRARNLLVTSVAETQAAADLARFFAPEIARQITSAEQPLRPGQGELRRAAVLQVDLTGFTRFAQTATPDEVMQMLTAYQARVVPVIRRFGGSVDKFMGDGVMATFGASRQSESFAADALRAAHAIAGATRDWHAAAGRPEVRLAVASGELVFGAVGDEDRLEYTVIGNVVNLAAKLEKHTRIAKVRALTTAETLRLARQQGYAEPPAAELPRQTVAGVAGPVDLVALA